MYILINLLSHSSDAAMYLLNHLAKDAIDVKSTYTKSSSEFSSLRICIVHTCYAFTSSYNISLIMFHPLTQFVVLLLSFLIFPTADGTSVTSLPIVDLGYELHQASSFDVSAFAIAVPYPFSSSFLTISTAGGRSLQFFQH